MTFKAFYASCKRAPVFIQLSLGEKKSVLEQSKHNSIHKVRLSFKPVCKLHSPN